MNLALLAKTAWLLIHSPNELWVRILKCKDGSTIHAFSDNWILNASLPLCSSFPNPNYKVSDLINHEDKTWNVALVEAFFTSENSQRICRMRIPVSGCDTLIWPFNKNGILTVKSVYNLLANELPHNSTPNPDLELHKALWKTPLLPKTQLFLWKCEENILPTGSKISSYSSNHDNRCKSCNSGVNKTPEHMILHCNFARNVWSNLHAVSHVIAQDLNSDISIKDWISKWLSTKNLLDKSVIVFTAAWYIWKDRCSKVFDNKTLNPQLTANTALSLADEAVSSLVNAVISNPQTVVVNEDNFLNTIPEINLLVFCDASFDKDTNNSGVGIVAMNHAGSFKGSKLVAGAASSPEGAESFAILEAAKWILSKNYQEIFLISDAKNVMAYLNNNKVQTSWSYCSVLDDCLFLLKDIHTIKYNHLKRNLNSIADLATKHSRIEKVTGEWDESSIPYFLQNDVNLF
ncbi:uncharacterized protein LOC113312521 [Papaver somniferum]|uniref:uncharacterized protein LOC113312521 n=1 Tax=Papaver somniferum TaxID=3469 RepID=UPI000E6F73BB|nr:uncharacterized protein LOC113312521 [Papaver somniferum]